LPQPHKTNHPQPQNRNRINTQIRASELRVLTAEGDNLGVLTREEALARAEEAGLDLIEISAQANPPVAKIMDYGKFQYAESKKARAQRAKQSSTETKQVQIKLGTGEHDLELKAKKASAWLKAGDRVKIELYLRGRAKYMDRKFLEERIDRARKLISEPHKVAQPMKKNPKGLFIVLERDTSGKSGAPATPGESPTKSLK
jgi:translation initiation factor IF-3